MFMELNILTFMELNISMFMELNISTFMELNILTFMELNISTFMESKISINMNVYGTDLTPTTEMLAEGHSKSGLILKCRGIIEFSNLDH